MKKIALFGKTFTDEKRPFIRQLVEKLESYGARIYIYKPCLSSFKKNIPFKSEIGHFTDHTDVIGKIDFLFSIGGDGTLLDTINFVRDSGIPILGINLGRMGFLSSISKEKIDDAVTKLFEGKFKIDKRTLLKVHTEKNILGELNYALNELTVYRKIPFSMLTIKTYVNGEYLNTYWADGLIVSTPTGSTAYSLSAGGPIILPGSQNFVITPIATHNLTVRPIVIPDNCEIKIKVEGRFKEFYVALDSRAVAVDSSVELTVTKEDFTVNLVQMDDESYFRTIRKKLMWGLDVRN